MSDREEIRWKFQVILGNITYVTDSLDNQSNTFDKDVERALRKSERQRNYRYSGIGFIIVVIVTFIVAYIGTVTWDTFANIAIIGISIFGILAIITFLRSEKTLEKEADIQQKINDVFFNMKIQKLLPLVSLITTISLDKSVTEEYVENLQTYASTYAKAMDYSFRWEVYQILIKDMTAEQRKEIKLSKFSHKPFEDTYQDAKNYLELFQKTNYSSGTVIIEDFIKMYEKNTKTKT